MASPKLVSAVFTSEDVDSIADERGIDRAVAQERIRLWAKHIEQRLIELGNEQIESVIVHEAP